MAEMTLYRQMRPMRFGDVGGQDTLVRALRNQVITANPAHAYLFCGPRGTGKTSTARIFARAINCMDPQEGEACGKCQSCQLLTMDNSTDIIEIDAASNNGVAEIRDLREKVRFAPVGVKYKVYIIDEVHMLSSGAFNALLKTLEEPPAHVIFILATTESHKLPATVISRCQRYDFKRISIEVITHRLKEAATVRGAVFEEEALLHIARAADGGMRDALSIADQAMATFGQDISAQQVAELLGGADATYLFAMGAALLQNDLQSAMQRIEEMMAAGRDPALVGHDLAQHLRNLLIAKIAQNSGNILDVSPDLAKEYQGQAALASEATLSRMLGIFLGMEGELRWSAQPRLVLELNIFRACTPQADQDVTALMQRIDALEKAISSGQIHHITAIPTTKQSAKLADSISKTENPQPSHADVPPPWGDETLSATPVQQPDISMQPIPPPIEEVPSLAHQDIPQDTPQVTTASTAASDGDTWTKTLEILRKEKFGVWNVYHVAMNTGIQGDQFILWFPQSQQVAAGMAERQNYVNSVKEILKRVSGQDYSVLIRVGEAGDFNTTQLIQDATELFGRENLIIDEN